MDVVAFMRFHHSEPGPDLDIANGPEDVSTLVRSSESQWWELSKRTSIDANVASQLQSARALRDVLLPVRVRIRRY